MVSTLDFDSCDECVSKFSSNLGSTPGATFFFCSSPLASCMEEDVVVVVVVVMIERGVGCFAGWGVKGICGQLAANVGRGVDC